MEHICISPSSKCYEYLSSGNGIKLVLSLYDELNHLLLGCIERFLLNEHDQNINDIILNRNMLLGDLQVKADILFSFNLIDNALLKEIKQLNLIYSLIKNSGSTQLFENKDIIFEMHKFSFFQAVNEKHLFITND